LGKIRSNWRRKQPKTCVWISAVGGKAFLQRAQPNSNFQQNKFNRSLSIHYLAVITYKQPSSPLQTPTIPTVHPNKPCNNLQRDIQVDESHISYKDWFVRQNVGKYHRHGQEIGFVRLNGHGDSIGHKLCKERGKAYSFFSLNIY